MPDATMAESSEPTSAATPSEAPSEAPPETSAEAPAETATPGTSRDPAARIQRLTTELRAAEAVITELKGRDLETTAKELSA